MYPRVLHFQDELFDISRDTGYNPISLIVDFIGAIKPGNVDDTHRHSRSRSGRDAEDLSFTAARVDADGIANNTHDPSFRFVDSICRDDREIYDGAFFAPNLIDHFTQAHVDNVNGLSIPLSDCYDPVVGFEIGRILCRSAGY